jgi:Cytochrome P460
MKASYLAGVVLTATSALLVAVASHGRTGTPGAPTGLEPVADAEGNMRVPEGYRANYEFLGSWAVAVAHGQGSKELHVVYASPGAASAYRKDGHFPESTVFVKEVFEAATATMTTGTVSHAQTLKGWFVMVRDSTGRHPGNRLWGDGWGWSWFDANNPSRTTSSDYRTDCLGCHVPAQSSEWLYVGGYPPLKP